MSDIASKHLTPPEASAYLKEKWGVRRAVPTLAKLRCVSSEGPEFIKANRQVIYTPESLDAFAKRLLSAPLKSTSEQVATTCPRLSLP